MSSELLEYVLFFLIAAVVVVPLFRKLGLGAILGYLIAGMLIGPQTLALITDPISILHFAEIGVIFLLFLIGLELNPFQVWRMRSDILLLGGSQVLLTALVITVCVSALTELSFAQSMVIGLAVALSSTAFAVQLMADKGILASNTGRKGFAILLLQDLAVIPIMFFVQFLAIEETTGSAAPWWYGIVLVLILLAAGKYVVPAMLKMIAKHGNRESMIAAALFIVVGASYLMDLAHLSMAMGAFIAGIMLANSGFRHQLETDLEPFKALTLGLFFIAIGMTLDIRLLLDNPLIIIIGAIALMLIKLAVIYIVLARSKESKHSKLVVAAMLSQGGEFAFVIMSQTMALNILPTDITNMVSLIVGLSMALTTPVVMLVGRLLSTKGRAKIDAEIPENEEPEAIIIGFGRYGQITGRLLSARKIRFAAIDIDPDHIDFVKKFSNKVYYGDGAQFDLLEKAGLQSAKVAVIAIDDTEKTKQIVGHIKDAHPDIVVVARARNRDAYFSLTHLGADVVVREAFEGSLEIAKNTLTSLGFSLSAAISHVEIFKQHDEGLLAEALEHSDNWDKVVEIGNKGRSELKELFKDDMNI